MRKAALYIGGFIIWLLFIALMMAVVFFTAGCTVHKQYYLQVKEVQVPCDSFLVEAECPGHHFKWKYLYSCNGVPFTSDERLYFIRQPK